MDIYQILRAEPSTDREILQQKYLGMLESCYIVAGSAESPEVRGIARKKLEQLQEVGRQAGLSEWGQSENGTMELNLTLIRLALNSSKSDEKLLLRIENQLDRLPDNAEKYYLKGVIWLKKRAGTENWKNAIRELSRSLALDPQAQGTRSLLNVLEEQLRAYERAQTLKWEEAQRAKREAEAKVRKEQESRERAAYIDWCCPVGFAVCYGGCFCTCGKTICGSICG